MTGLERLGRAFERAAAERRTALIAFIAAGDPDFETTVAAARAAVDAGADVIELGVPFSDPLADGPVIQAAYERALRNGATVAAVLDCARDVVRATDAPVVLMTGVNPPLAFGARSGAEGARELVPFCEAAARAGAAGVLVPDLPLEDAAALRESCAANRLGTVFLAAPDSGDARVEAAARASTGFVYVVRRRGVTGAGGAADTAATLERARAAASAPVAVGFGIATAADAREAAQGADGVIVGSALVQASHDAGGGAAGAAAVGERVAELVDALRETASAEVAP